MEAPPPPDMNQAPTARKSNLTWVWILVGVIVICGCGGAGVLGAILVPVFMQARSRATEARCMANVKEASLAQLMYLADSDDQMPPTNKWIDLTAKYVKTGDPFTCPAVRRSGGQYGYAISGALSGKTAAAIDNPWKEILLFETGKLARNVSGDPKTEPFPNRHGKGRTESYLDGHAKWIKPPASSASP